MAEEVKPNGEPEPEWVTVAGSSNVATFRYDTNKSIWIRFKGGNVYEYKNVPDEVYQGLVGAESAGEYVHDKIRGKYEYRKVLPEEDK